MTGPEKWVWHQIRHGDTADFNKRDHDVIEPRPDLDPEEETGWGARRRLRLVFLETLLTREAYIDRLGQGGVRILGALIDGSAEARGRGGADHPCLKLEHARVPHLLWLRRCRILAGIQAYCLRVDGELSLEDSLVQGPLCLGSAEVKGPLRLYRGRYRSRVDLRNADIGSYVTLQGSVFAGSVELDGSRVGRTVFLNADTNVKAARFEKALSLTVANLGADLDMSGAAFQREINLEGIKVKGSITLGGDTPWRDRDRAPDALGSVFVTHATVGGNLDLAGRTFHKEVDFSGARIHGELRLCRAMKEEPKDTGNPILAYWATEKRPAPALILRNVSAESLQDWWGENDQTSWPKNVKLEGFRYDRFGGLAHGGDRPYMYKRETKCFKEWLERSTPFSPQSYEHLAQVFRKAGEPEKANDILYGARERRRRSIRIFCNIDPGQGGAVRRLYKWLGLNFLRATIGYGLGRRYTRLFWWILAFTLTGFAVLCHIGLNHDHRYYDLLFASFDQFIPILKLDDTHTSIIFGTASGSEIRQRGLLFKLYFYTHTIFGFLLGSFLAAGLAGLTQRN